MSETSTYTKKKLSKLKEEIRRFDRVLEESQEHLCEDVDLYDRVVVVRDSIFRLQQQLHGCEKIIGFRSSGGEGLDNDDDDDDDYGIAATTTAVTIDTLWYEQGEREGGLI